VNIYIDVVDVLYRDVRVYVCLNNIRVFCSVDRQYCWIALQQLTNYTHTQDSQETCSLRDRSDISKATLPRTTEEGRCSL